jgi:hypothetical protein
MSSIAGRPTPDPADQCLTLLPLGTLPDVNPPLSQSLGEGLGVRE